jgi:uncharacterized protein YkwD
MVRRSRYILLSAATALVMALLALAAAPRPASAGGAACERWGSVNPADLTKKQARKSVLCLVNRERADAGLGALKRSKKLERAAQKHTNRMRGTGCFDHECPGEADLGSRLDAVGYLGGGLLSWLYAENIAWGRDWRGTPSAIVDAWMDSPPHRANILSGNLRDIGVGFAKGTPTSTKANGGLYTQDFGHRTG